MKRTSKFIYLATPTIGLSDKESELATYYALRGYGWGALKGHPIYSPGLAMSFKSSAGQAIDSGALERAKRRAIQVCDVFVVLPYAEGNVGFHNAEIKRDMAYALELGKRVLAAVPRYGSDPDGEPGQFKFQRMK